MRYFAWLFPILVATIPIASLADDPPTTPFGAIGADISYATANSKWDGRHVVVRVSFGNDTPFSQSLSGTLVINANGWSVDGGSEKYDLFIPMVFDSSKKTVLKICSQGGKDYLRLENSDGIVELYF